MVESHESQKYLDIVRVLSVKERRFLALYIEDMNATKAYQVVSPEVKITSAATLGHRTLNRIKRKVGGTEKLLEAFNLGLDRLFGEIHRKLNAMETRYYQAERLGIFEDNKTQMDAVELLAVLHGFKRGSIDAHLSNADGGPLIIRYEAVGLIGGNGEGGNGEDA